LPLLMLIAIDIIDTPLLMLWLLLSFIFTFSLLLFIIDIIAIDDICHWYYWLFRHCHFIDYAIIDYWYWLLTLLLIIDIIAIHWCH
jgi:hypothetical protein